MNLNVLKSWNKARKQEYFSKTGILVDIQNIGRNTECLVAKEEESLEEVYPNVWLKKGSKKISGGNFTNIYDLFWHPTKAYVEPIVYSSKKAYFLQNIVKKNSSIIAAVNGSFFFLTDVADKKPLDLQYDFCVREGVVYGLPSGDHPILYTKNGKLLIRNIKAHGKLSIGGKLINWRGARKSNLKRSGIVLYNSKCSNIIRLREPEKNVQIGILDNENILTPKSPDRVDIVIRMNRQKQLVVKSIVEGGGTHFFDGLFILQMPKSKLNFKKGDIVTPLSIDGLSLQGISSSISIAKGVYDPFFAEKKRASSRDSRVVIAKDARGFMHFTVIDGSKYIPGFLGPNFKDMRKLFPKNIYKWAYYLDGGGSSRLIVRKKRELVYLANEFVFQKMKNGRLLWDWKKGRRIASSIAIQVPQN